MPVTYSTCCNLQGIARVSVRCAGAYYLSKTTVLLPRIYYLLPGFHESSFRLGFLTIQADVVELRHLNRRHHAYGGCVSTGERRI